MAEAGGGPEGSISEPNCWAWGEQSKVEGEESLRVKGREQCVHRGPRAPLLTRSQCFVGCHTGVGRWLPALAQ